MQNSTSRFMVAATHTLRGSFKDLGARLRRWKAVMPDPAMVERIEILNLHVEALAEEMEAIYRNYDRATIPGYLEEKAKLELAEHLRLSQTMNYTVAPTKGMYRRPTKRRF